MSPATDDVAALLILVPEGSPAIELIEAMANNPDDSERALQAVLSEWAAVSDLGDGST